VSDGEVHFATREGIASVVFDRPKARNSMTFAMYDQLAAACAAIACDFRIATPAACFGVPIARTLGNCLSMANTARLVAELGPARSRRLLLLGDAISAEEALSCGFVVEVVQPDAIDDVVSQNDMWSACFARADYDAHS
jgi:enoyl-CoA hydratase/carnithine racemase